MTASEKLAKLIENDKLTDKQRDKLDDWGILTVSEVEDYLIDSIHELKNETHSVDYKEAVSTLYDLLNYIDDDEYIVYDESGVTRLNFDTLIDALDVD